MKALEYERKRKEKKRRIGKVERREKRKMQLLSELIHIRTKKRSIEESKNEGQEVLQKGYVTVR